MAVPDFFVVGHQKSGTTALYEMLRSHPEVFMPTLKEPRFFATDLRSRLRPPALPQAPTLDPTHARGLPRAVCARH